MERRMLALVAGLAVLASGCDKREVKRATVSLNGGNVTVDGDRNACLKQVYVEYAGTNSVDGDEATPWRVTAPDKGCINFPVTVGVTPPGATGAAPGNFQINEDYRVVGSNDTARYETKFQRGSNGVFYVQQPDFKMVDITKAKQ